jgi:hypothetical protein
MNRAEGKDSVGDAAIIRNDEEVIGLDETRERVRAASQCTEVEKRFSDIHARASQHHWLSHRNRENKAVASDAFELN